MPITVSEALSQFAAYLLVAAGIVVIGYVWATRSWMKSHANRDVLFNKFVEDYRDRVVKLEGEQKILSERLYTQGIDHEKDRGRWLTERAELQARIDRLTEQIAVLQAEIDKMETASAEREIIIAEQTTMIQKLTESRDTLKEELARLTERFNTEKNNE